MLLLMDSARSVKYYGIMAYTSHKKQYFPVTYMVISNLHV